MKLVRTFWCSLPIIIFHTSSFPFRFYFEPWILFIYSTVRKMMFFFFKKEKKMLEMVRLQGSRIEYLNFCIFFCKMLCSVWPLVLSVDLSSSQSIFIEKQKTPLLRLYGLDQTKILTTRYLHIDIAILSPSTTNSIESIRIEKVCNLILCVILSAICRLNNTL